MNPKLDADGWPKRPPHKCVDCTPKPSFATTDKEFLLIAEIAKRAVRLGMKGGFDVDCTEISMDVTACHANGNPLRLAELLKADDGNFGHDVFGIQRFIDRNTGKMTDCFRPR